MRFLKQTNFFLISLQVWLPILLLGIKIIQIEYIVVMYDQVLCHSQVFGSLTINLMSLELGLFTAEAKIVYKPIFLT